MQKQIVILRGSQATEYIRNINLAKGVPEITIDRGVLDWTKKWLAKTTGALSAHSYTVYANAWLSTVTGDACCEIQSEQISRWVNSEGIKLTTRKIRLAIMRHLFKYLSARELVAPNPCLLVTVDYNSLAHTQKESRVVKPFTDDDLKKLLAFIEARLASLDDKINEMLQFPIIVGRLEERRANHEFWKAAAVISRCTGLRLGDIANLESEAMGPPLVCWTRKRHKRVQPHVLWRELYEQATKFLCRSGQYVFEAKRKMYLNGRTRSVMSGQFTKLCAQAGLEGLHFHCLRYQYSRKCRELGIPTPHISEFMGHSSVEMTEHYLGETC